MSVATKLDNQIVQHVSKEVEISHKQVQNVIALVEDGNTVPFIARYRKEQTGALMKSKSGIF